MFGMFKKLASNRAINSAHPPSVSVQNQQRVLQQLQQANKAQQKTLNRTPDFDSRTQDLMKRNQEMLRRQQEFRR